jgi:CRISPR-associated protein Csx14
MRASTRKAENRYRRGVMIATLGVEPQVVTISLDFLLSNNEQIVETAIIYTDQEFMHESLRVIENEFDKMAYPGISLRKVPVVSPEGIAVKDFYTNEDLKSLFRVLYREIHRARKDDYAINLIVSGGRKVMGIMAMVVAQLLFGSNDRVWHLITEGWQPGSSRNLHFAKEAKNSLVPVPVLRWSESGTLLKSVAELDDPSQVVVWFEKLNRSARFKRQREFIEHWLTLAEREIVRLVCKGFDNSVIADTLYKREQTVANQLRNIYEKLREWLEYPETNTDRSRLIAEFAPYYAMCEESSGNTGLSERKEVIKERL